MHGRCQQSKGKVSYNALAYFYWKRRQNRWQWMGSNNKNVYFVRSHHIASSSCVSAPGTCTVPGTCSRYEDNRSKESRGISTGLNVRVFLSKCALRVPDTVIYADLRFPQQDRCLSFREGDLCPPARDFGVRNSIHRLTISTKSKKKK